jgi:hypothetical protein
MYHTSIITLTHIYIYICTVAHDIHKESIKCTTPHCKGGFSALRTTTTTPTDDAAPVCVCVCGVCAATLPREDYTLMVDACAGKSLRFTSHYIHTHCICTTTQCLNTTRLYVHAPFNTTLPYTLHRIPHHAALHTILTHYTTPQPKSQQLSIPTTPQKAGSTPAWVL